MTPTPAQIEAAETDGQLLQRLGADAALWAAEFRKTAIKLSYSDMDEGWLIGWFANAIENAAVHRASAAEVGERNLHVPLNDAVEIGHQIEDATIERCAQVAAKHGGRVGNAIAAAIRAMKEKP